MSQIMQATYHNLTSNAYIASLTTDRFLPLQWSRIRNYCLIKFLSSKYLSLPVSYLWKYLFFPWLCGLIMIGIVTTQRFSWGRSWCEILTVNTYMKVERAELTTSKFTSDNWSACVISTIPSSPTGVGAVVPPIIFGATNAITWCSSLTRLSNKPIYYHKMFDVADILTYYRRDTEDISRKKCTSQNQR